jgi:molecular chaperone GrpE (heat shock protein)
MLLWLRRRFTARSKAPALPGGTLPAESPPSWATALLEAVQKSSRAQARLALQIEDLDRKLEGGLAEWRNSSAQKSAATGLSAGPEPLWENVLDALDLLDEATRLADPALAPGLAGVTDRLVRFLAHSGLTRLAPLGHQPDGRLFRVVGTQPYPSNLVEGDVIRVVRAAVLRGEHVVREGEVITVRNPS